MVGLLLGAASFGQLSDSVGRKKAYFISFTIMIMCGLVSAFSPKWEVYAACRFFVGIGFGAIMVVNCVYPLEFVGHRWRTLCGTIGFWAIGGMILALCVSMFNNQSLINVSPHLSVG
jgi:MFS family permease